MKKGVAKRERQRALVHSLCLRDICLSLVLYQRTAAKGSLGYVQTHTHTHTGTCTKLYNLSSCHLRAPFQSHLHGDDKL